MFKKKQYDYDFIVIGSGAGGSVGAHYAASRGKKVALFEMEAIGGECPNFACVPTKALLHSAKLHRQLSHAETYGIKIPNVSLHYQKVKEWKDLVVSRTGVAHGKESFQKDGIHVYHAKAHFISPFQIEAGGKVYSSRKFLLATGSQVFIPPIPGLAEAGYATFKQAIDFTKLPSSLLIIGGGAVACEMAQVFSSFGSKVVLVNRSERLLSREDSEVSHLVQAIFENRGVSVLLNTSIERIEKKSFKKEVIFQKNGEEQKHDFDEIIVASGKVPQLDFNPERAGILLDKDKKILINKYLQTSQAHIYAAGDVISPYLYTHVGYYQSYIASHNAFASNKLIPDYRVVPRCIFLEPEVASVGITELEAKKKNLSIKKGLIALAILGRANTTNELDGFIKIITDKKGVIIGGSIVAPSAGEMIHEIALAIKLRVKANIVAEMLHAYPTFSEGIKIACSIIE